MFTQRLNRPFRRVLPTLACVSILACALALAGALVLAQQPATTHAAGNVSVINVGKYHLNVAFNVGPNAAPPLSWKICWQKGQLNILTCSALLGNEVTQANPNQFLGSSAYIGGLKKNQWYTVKVKAVYAHGEVSLGNAKAKTSK